MLNLKKLLTKILTEIKNKTKAVQYTDQSVLTNSYVSISYPTGYSSSDTIIIQPTYTGNSQLGWTATIQPQASNIILYVRIGSSPITAGLKISFKAIFIKAS